MVGELFLRALVYVTMWMPQADRGLIDAAYLIENTQLAIEAYEAAPWHDQVPEEIFMDYILPYRAVGEEVERWRPDFRKRFAPVVKDCKTPLEAALVLNRDLWKMIDVKYSTKREKHDQAPFHSMRIHIASCTGLSIILVDACRAVGVPARLVGCRWRGRPGNHTWVEVWSGGEWSYLGAFDGQKANDGWFADFATNAVAGGPYAIHAVSWRPTGLLFYADPSMSAMDVTARYLKRPPADPSMGRVVFDLRDKSGERLSRRVRIWDAASGKLLFDQVSHNHAFDFNDHLTCVLKKGLKVRVQIAEESPYEMVVTE